MVRLRKAGQWALDAHRLISVLLRSEDEHAELSLLRERERGGRVLP